jgi:hypothetical protein
MIEFLSADGRVRAVVAEVATGVEVVLCRSARAFILLIAVLVFPSMISAQQFTPDTGPEKTCTQQMGQCTEVCNSWSGGSGGRTGHCRTNCMRRHADCMATGFWERRNGDKVPRHRQ